MLHTTVRAAFVAALALGTLAACTTTNETPSNAPVASQQPAAVGPSPPAYAQPGNQVIPPPTPSAVTPSPSPAPPAY